MLSYILWGLALYLLSGYWVVYMSIREGESKEVHYSIGFSGFQHYVHFL